MPQTAAVENASAPFFRSRSIDSMSAGHTTDESSQIESNKRDQSNDEKSNTSTGFARTFRVLRKRLSRTANAHKIETMNNQYKPNIYDKNSRSKVSGDDSEASSAGEDSNNMVFSELTCSKSDTADLSTENMLTKTLSNGSDTIPRIIATMPFTDALNLHEKNDENATTFEQHDLSKTWSGSSFTGAQLRGTCSLEYTEHMKEKSHRRKAHLVDLRKDDSNSNQSQQNASNNLMPTNSLSSNSTITISLKTHHSLTLTKLFTNHKSVLC